jgi:protein O-mannosyl-transferase
MSNRVAGILVAAFVVAAYAASLPGTFQYDDYPTILRNTAVQDVGNLTRVFTTPELFSGLEGNSMYRPVLLTTYIVNYQIAGFRPFVWHLTNILFHALNGFLVVILTSGLLSALRPGKPAGLIPLLAGLAFALHPVHSEVVNYISSRSGAIATMGFLAALILHLRWTRGRLTALRRTGLLALSMAFLAIGYGGKEIVAALPPVILALELLDPANGKPLRRMLVAGARAAPAILVTLLYLYLRKQFMGSTGVNVTGRMFEVSGKVDLYWGGGRTVFQNLITQARVFWMYAGLLVFPVDLAVDRFVRVSTSITETGVLVSLSGLVVLCSGLLLAARRAPLVTLCGAIFFFGLAPTSSFVPLNVLMNEHRIYLPGVGFAILVALPMAALLARWPRRGAALLSTVGACALVLIVTRSLVWQDPLRLWEDSARVSPKSYRSHNQLGAAWQAKAAQLGSVPAALPLLDKAEAEFRIAADLYPVWYNAHLNLGIVHRARGLIAEDDAEFEAALLEFEKCRGLAKGEWRARLEIAATHGQWKHYEEAIRLYEEMADEERGEKAGPRNPLYLRPMARLSVDREDFESAVAFYREILATRENDHDAYLGLARALEADDRLEEAKKVLGEFVERRGDDPEVHMTCAKFLAGLTPPDRKAAAAHFQKALSLGHHPTPEEFDRYLGGE